MFHQLHMVTRERRKESEVKVSKLVLMFPQLHMATWERQKELMTMFCQHHITTSDSRAKNEESKMREKPYLIFPGLLLVWQFFRGVGQQCHTWQQHGHTSSSKIHSCLAPFLLHDNNMDTHPHLNPLRLCIIPAPCQQHGHTPSSQSTQALYHSCSMPTTCTHTLISIHSGFVSFLLHANNMDTHPHLNPLRLCIIPAPCQQHGHTPSSQSTQALYHSCSMPTTCTHTLISIHSGFVSFLLHANNMDTHPHLNPLRLCIIPAPCKHGQTPSSQSTQALYHSCSMQTWTDTIISIHSGFVSFLLHANMDRHHHLNPLRLCIIPAPCKHGQTPSSQSTCALYHSFFTPATRTHTIISIHSLHTTPFFLYTSNMYTHPHLNPLMTWTGSHCTLHHSFFIPPPTTKPRTHTRRKKMMGVGYMGTRWGQTPLQTHSSRPQDITNER